MHFEPWSLCPSPGAIFAPGFLYAMRATQHDTATLRPKKIPNAGRDLALLHEHLAKDDLIAWGWNPGLGRVPVPGTQARLGELIQAWIDTGAQCP
jgi:hypothetical protein